MPRTAAKRRRLYDTLLPKRLISQCKQIFFKNGYPNPQSGGDKTKKAMSFDKRLQHSIDLLRKSESLALRYYDKGFYLAFSGGKDSQALYHVAQLAGVKFEAHYALTTLDPPELVYFIKHQYPDVIIDRPALNFSQLCIKKKALPTMLMRFCCAELKETKGAGTVTLTGVRRAESYRRSLRNEAEITRRKFSGTLEQLDQFTREKEVEGVQCIKGKDKIIINPIIEWTEQDVWHFLNNVVKAPHCELYDTGRTRLGCLFCPMSSKKNIARDAKEYPKYKAIMLRTIRALRGNGYMMNLYPDLTDEEVFDWWTSRENIKSWYASHKLQKSLFDKI